MNSESTPAISGTYGPFSMISTTLPGMDNQTSIRIYVAQGDDKTALIDSGIPEGYGQLMRAFDELGIKKSQLDYLLISHEHMDHVGNNAQLVGDTGCTVLAHRNRADRIGDNMLNAKTIVHAFPDVEPLFDLQKEYLSWMGPESAPVDGFIKGGDIIDLGNVKIEVIELLGHSMAEIGFYHDASKTLVIADPLMPAYDLVLNLYEDPNQMQATHRATSIPFEAKERAICAPIVPLPRTDTREISAPVFLGMDPSFAFLANQTALFEVEQVPVNRQ